MAGTRQYFTCLAVIGSHLMSRRAVRPMREVVVWSPPGPWLENNPALAGALGPFPRGRIVIGMQMNPKIFLRAGGILSISTTNPRKS